MLGLVEITELANHVRLYSKILKDGNFIELFKDCGVSLICFNSRIIA